MVGGVEGDLESFEEVCIASVRDKEMGRIGRLSAAVVSHLRSNTVVSSFEQAVEELICNSLDAGATQVPFFEVD